MFYNIRHSPQSLQTSPEEKPYRFVEKLPAFSRKGHMLFRERGYAFVVLLWKTEALFPAKTRSSLLLDQLHSKNTNIGLLKRFSRGNRHNLKCRNN